MRNWRWLLLVLAVLLGLLQYRFWFGQGNSGEVMMLEAQVENQEDLEIPSFLRRLAN